MRYLVMAIALLSGLMAGGEAGAAHVSGTVYFKGKLDKTVAVGYAAVTDAGSTVSNMAGLTPMGEEASVWCDTYKPRRTGLTWNASTGLAFEHTNLPAGRYLFFVRYGANYLDTRLLKVPAGNARLRTTLAISPSQAGDLRILAPEKRGLHSIELSPVDARGRDYLGGLPFGSVPSAQGESSTGRFNVRDLRAGKYRLSLRRAHRKGDPDSGQFTTYEDVGSWLVEVRAGKVSEYRL